MIAPATIEIADEAEKTQHALCDLLLEVVCKDANRLAYVRRHVRVARAAMPYMTKAQVEIAEQRIGKLRTKWGEVLFEGDYEAEKLAFPPETMVVNFLAQRRSPEALLKMMHRAAQAVWQGDARQHDPNSARAPDSMLHRYEAPSIGPFAQEAENGIAEQQPSRDPMLVFNSSGQGIHVMSSRAGGGLSGQQRPHGHKTLSRRGQTATQRCYTLPLLKPERGQ